MAGGSATKKRAVESVGSVKKQGPGSGDEKKAQHWMGKLQLQSIAETGGAGVDLHQARQSRDRMSEAPSKIQFARKIELAEWAQKLAPGNLNKTSRDEAVAAMEQLEGKISFPSHIAEEMLEKDIIACIGQVVADPCDETLTRLMHLVMPFDISMAIGESAEYNTMLAPLVPQKVTLNAKNPRLAGLNQDEETKAGNSGHEDHRQHASPTHPGRQVLSFEGQERRRVDPPGAMSGSA